MYKKLTESSNILAIIIYVFILSLVQATIHSLVSDFTNNTGLRFLFTFIFSILILYLLFKEDIVNDTKNFKETIKNNKKSLIIAFLSFTTLSILSNTILTNILGTIPENEFLTRNALKEQPILMLISIIILGPITEELIYRLPFKKVKKHRLITYIIYSALFAIMHISATPTLNEFLFLIPYFFLSLNFGYGLYKTDNIHVSIIIHIIYNLINIMLLFIM